MSELPKWLVNHLEEIAIAENFARFKINLKNEGQKGDYFVGAIRCVEIVGEKVANGSTIAAKLSLVCKVLPTNEIRRKLFHVDTAFEREALFYNEIAPMFIQFQRERGLNDDEMFHKIPKCYKAVNEPSQSTSVVILQDLRPDGFRMWPKNKVQIVENSRMIVRELAKYHAISFAMKDQCPEKMKKYEQLDDFFPRFFKSEGAIESTRKKYANIVSIMRKRDLGHIYEEFSKDIYQYILSCSDESVPNKYRVIGHGDCWNNNILYKFDEVLRNFFSRFRKALNSISFSCSVATEKNCL